ncbi:MAG: TonB-dependent receptor [Proteobacteria bacterium]|nr:TonB-dependent receptor [Pseudomonadota bacterium]
MLIASVLLLPLALDAGEQTKQKPLQAELHSDKVSHDTVTDCYSSPDTSTSTSTSTSTAPSGRVDLFQESFSSGVCQAIRWVDNLFGDTYSFNEDEVSGRIALGLEYRQYDDFNYHGRFHVRAPLKNLNSKFNLFFGRVDENAYISDTQPNLPGSFHDGIFGEDESWLLGLGYRQTKYKNRGFSFSAGVKLPFDPYAKARYRYDKSFNDKQFMRFRQTFFWRSERGFGTTSRLNLFHRTNSGNLLRWDNTMTIAENDIEGVKWFTGGTLYHRLHDNHAISMQAFINGETKEEVHIQDYGLRMIWRRPIGREWLFIEVGPSITWPREKLLEEREMSLGFSILVEMQFGDYKY